MHMSLGRRQRRLAIIVLLVSWLCLGPGDWRAGAKAAGRTDDRYGSAPRVEVRAGDSVGTFETHAATVGELLGRQGILVGPLDVVSPDLEVPIEDGLVVTISRIARNFENAETPIAARVVWRGDPNVPLDRIQTRTVGKPGRIATRARLTHRAGEAPDRDLVESRTLQEAVDTVFVFGQKITRFTFTTLEGQSLAYWRKTRMLATSYSAANAGTPEDKPWYGYTFSGEPMGNGVVAADLDIVPLRTRLYIPRYGHGTVLDTGSGLSGLHIDLGYADDEYVSWYRVVDVYWLWPPPADPSEIVWILPSAPPQN